MRLVLTAITVAAMMGSPAIAQDGRDLFERASELKAEGELEAAYRLFELVCEQHDPRGCGEQGWLLKEGKAPEDGYERGFELVAQACADGYDLACWYTGYEYVQGRGREKNLATGLDYYNRGCREGAGEPTACNAVGYALGHFGGADGASDIAEAFRYYRLACEGTGSGAAMGCLNLAYAFRQGKGDAETAGEAIPLAQKACDMGSDQACNYVSRWKREDRQADLKTPHPPEEMTRLGQAAIDAHNPPMPIDLSDGRWQIDTSVAEISAVSLETETTPEGYVRAWQVRPKPGSAGLLISLMDIDCADKTYSTLFLAQTNGLYRVTQASEVPGKFYEFGQLSPARRDFYCDGEPYGKPFSGGIIAAAVLLDEAYANSPW